MTGNTISRKKFLLLHNEPAVWECRTTVDAWSLAVGYIILSIEKLFSFVISK
ncbi:MAG TPA: hypothetical protein VFW07_18950 [Parafilimonas sp.]|nr:hypothetical protein [Parafilimonas sp.]